MINKEPLDPRRVRLTPREGFSWIDRRFVALGYLEALSPGAALLYFFLVAVADHRGLSFYSDPRVSNLLALDPGELTGARSVLVDRGLILYRYPLYQVLPIAEGRNATTSEPDPGRMKAARKTRSLAEILDEATRHSPEEGFPRKA